MNNDMPDDGRCTTTRNDEEKYDFGGGPVLFEKPRSSHLPAPSPRRWRWQRRLDVAIAWLAMHGIALVAKPFLRVSPTLEHVDDGMERMIRDGLYRRMPDGSAVLVIQPLPPMDAKQRDDLPDRVVVPGQDARRET